MKHRLHLSAALALAAASFLTPARQAAAAGTWKPLVHTAPAGIELMLLLTDGTVMAQAYSGSAWYKLTPDATGSYVNGTWSTLASMHDTRLYYSSDVLVDGRVFVAGAEYGSGGATAEVYDPVANTWTLTPAAPVTNFIDSMSETLANGTVMVAPVSPSTANILIYNPTTNAWSAGPSVLHGQDESGWVKLADGSILTIDGQKTSSERYIPAQNKWVVDGTVPVNLWDGEGEEGAGVLLASGKVFFLGATGHTALYTPTGTASPGTWVAGPDLPNAQGTDDAPAAVMVSGVVLCAVGPTGTYNSPTSFYEYDPIANAFTQISGPTGTTLNTHPYLCNMLDLPDGTVLFSSETSQLYEYVPSGAPLAAGKPTISSIVHNGDGSYTLSGTLLNGISEGAAYGDDAQMATNYPIVRLISSSGNATYCRTSNWSSEGVMTGSTPLTTKFTLPAGLASGEYSLQTVANGNASASAAFAYSSTSAGISGTHVITCKSSGLCLNDPGSSTANGTVMIQYTVGTTSNEEWTFNLNSDGSYTLVNGASGKVLDDPNSDATPGTKVDQWSSTASANQRWWVVPLGGGYYEIQNEATGLVLEDPGSSPTNGQQLDLWTWNGGANQFWSISTSPEETEGPVATDLGRKAHELTAADGSVILQVGDSAPGLTGTVINDLGTLSDDSVVAHLKKGAGGITSATGEVLITGLASGSPQVAAQSGTNLPGLPSGTEVESFLGVDGDGTDTFFLASMRSPSFGAGVHTALCAVLPTGDIGVLAYAGQTVGSKTVAIVGTLVQSRGILADHRWRVDGSTVGVRLTFTDKSEAICTIPAGASTTADWTVLLETGPSSISGLGGASIKSFGLPCFSSAGMAVLANLASAGPAPLPEEALLAVANGTPHVVARPGDAVTLDTEGASVGGVRIKMLDDPLINADGAVMCTLTETGTQGAAADRKAVAFAADGATLRLLARHGAEAPGGGVWKSFGSPLLPGSNLGAPAFIGTLDISAGLRIAKEENTGLWAVDAGGTLQSLLRAGQSVTVNGSSKIIKSITAISAAGDPEATTPASITAEVTFAGGDNGIVKVLVP